MKLDRKALLLIVAAATFAIGATLAIVGLVSVIPGSSGSDETSVLRGTPPSSEGEPAAASGEDVTHATEDATSTTVVDSSSPPTRLIIEAIGVEAQVITLGLDSTLIPQVPSAGSDVAWYDFSAKPDTGGNVVLSGHVTWDKAPAVFWRLQELKEGDIIKLETDEGDQAIYEVRTNLVVDPSDPESVNLIHPTGTEMVTLVTCGGTFVPDAANRFGGEYTNRVVVQAEPVS